MARKTRQILKIGYVLDDGLDRPDGVQQYIKALGQYMSQQGHDVRYLVGETKDPGPGLKKYTNSLAKNIKISFNKNSMTIPLPSSTRRVKQTLNHGKYDVLHVQCPYSPFLGGKIIKHAHPETAVVGTFHIIGDSWVENYGTRLLSLAQQRTLKRFDSFGCTSNSAQQFVSSYFGRQQTKIYPCLTDVRSYKMGNKLKEFDDGKINIIFLGRLVKRKGARHLIEALQYLDPKLLKKIRVMVCGTGQLAAELEKRVEELGLSNTVEFLGFIDEAKKKDYYASADLAVFPATGGESFGIVLIEAMATGKAVVLGGNNPGYQSVLGDGPDLLFDSYDHRALAAKLEHFINDKKAAKQAKAWQMKRVEEFSIETVGKMMLQEYQEAVAKRNQD